jgi:hypothetical protein
MLQASKQANLRLCCSTNGHSEARLATHSWLSTAVVLRRVVMVASCRVGPVQWNAVEWTEEARQKRRRWQ